MIAATRAAEAAKPVFYHFDPREEVPLSGLQNLYARDVYSCCRHGAMQ